MLTDETVVTTITSYCGDTYEKTVYPSGREGFKRIRRVREDTSISGCKPSVLTDDRIKELEKLGREASSKARQELCDRLNEGRHKGPDEFTLAGELAAARTIAEAVTAEEQERIMELEGALRDIAHGKGISHSAAVAINAEFIEATFGKMRCDSEGSSACKRCSAVAAGRWSNKFQKRAEEALKGGNP